MRAAIAMCLLAGPAFAAGASPTYTTTKPGGVYDVVVNGGADPTGVANSSTAFQTGASSGQPVWVPVGTYRILTATTWPSNSSLLCQGASSTTAGATLIVDPANTAAGGGALAIVTNGSNITFDGCVFDGNKPSFPTTTSRLLFVNGGDHVVIRNSTFQNSNPLGIAMANTPNPITSSGVDNSIFSNVGLAVPVLNFTAAGNNTAVSFPGAGRGTNNYVTSSTFSDIGDNGVTAQNQSFFTAQNNYFNMGLKQWRLATGAGTGAGYGPAAIWVTSTAGEISDHATITDNLVLGVTGNCLDLFANFLTVRRNYIDTCGGAGVALGNTDLLTAGSTIDVIDNVISNSGISWRSGDFQRANINHTGGISISCGAAPCSSPGTTSHLTIMNNAFLNNGWDVWLKKDRTMAVNDMRVWMETSGPQHIINAE